MEEVTYDVSPFSIRYLSQKVGGGVSINDNWVIACFFLPSFVAVSQY